jgi:hypothetical protein
MFLLTNNEIIVYIFSLRTLYCKIIKMSVFFIKNRNRLFDLSRLTSSHSRMICLRIWINSSNCDVMFFHVLRIHNRIIRSRAFVARICHIVFWLDSSRNRWKFEKNVWFQTFIFFFWFWSFFISKKRFSSS